jgi:hypothetical protein
MRLEAVIAAGQRPARRGASGAPKRNPPPRWRSKEGFGASWRAVQTGPHRSRYYSIYAPNGRAQGMILENRGFDRAVVVSRENPAAPRRAGILPAAWMASGLHREDVGEKRKRHRTGKRGDAVVVICGDPAAWRGGVRLGSRRSEARRGRPSVIQTPIGCQTVLISRKSRMA